MKSFVSVFLFFASTIFCYGQALSPNIPAAKQLASEKAKALKGNAEAMLHMGQFYYYGSGVPKNYITASQWLIKAEKKGNVAAAEMLGEMYEEGTGVKKDIQKALTLLKKAAQKGSGEAAFEVGSLYEEGDGLPANMTEAVKWYKTGAEKNNTDAMMALAFCYLEGDGVQADKAAGVEWFTKAANNGNRQAMRFLGEYYKEGEIGNDCVKATDWYMKAADLGDTPSVKAIAVLTLEGKCKGLDNEHIAKWMLKKADGGNAEACFYMAAFFIEGIGVQKDAGRAMEMLMKDREIRDKSGMQRLNATNNIFLLYNSGDLSQAQMERLLAWMEETARKTDDDELMSVIANIYLNKDDATPADYRVAMDYAMKSAQKGNPAGCFWVGFIYSKGYGDIKRSDKKAFTWILKSAELGDKDAMKMVSSFYENGTGVERNEKLAEQWKNKAGKEE